MSECGDDRYFDVWERGGMSCERTGLYGWGKHAKNSARYRCVESERQIAVEQSPTMQEGK